MHIGNTEVWIFTSCFFGVILSQCNTSLNHPYIFKLTYLPSLWNLPYPVHAAVLHRDVGIKTPGDGLIDNKLFLLIQQSYLTFLELDKTVNLRAFGIEKANYGILLLARGNRKFYIFYLSISYRLTYATSKAIKYFVTVIGM